MGYVRRKVDRKKLSTLPRQRQLASLCVTLHAVAFFFSDLSECKCLLFSFSQVSPRYILWNRMLFVEAASDHI